VRARTAEATALGAAAMAGVGAGLLALEDLPALIGEGERIVPQADADADYREWRGFAEAAAALA
jgi:glycerol kinase